MRLKSVFGFNLVDLLMTMTIVSLLTAAALPSILRAKQNNQADAQVNSIVKTINLARATAIDQNTLVTVCGLDSKGHCTNNDIQQIAVFIDRNHNLLLDQSEEIETLIELDFVGEVQFNTSKRTAALLFKNDGSALHYGELSLCANEKVNWLSRQIKIERSGIPFIAANAEQVDCS